MSTEIRLPVSYNVINDEEMTYTCGGANVADSALIAMGASSVVVGAISIVNLVWALGSTRSWISKNKGSNKTATDVLSLSAKGVDAVANYASKSVWNAIVTVYSAANLVTWWPVTAVAWLTA